MPKPNATRKSHCSICGKRLSAVTATGNIRWQPSVVDDKGIYCETCAPPPTGKKTSKASRA